MKTKILLPALVLLLVFASCSNMRYSHMPKVKTKKQMAVAQKEPAKKEKAQPGLIETKKQAVADVPVNYEIQGTDNVLPASPGADNTQATPKTVAKKPAKTKTAQDVLSPRQIKKLKKLEKQAATQEAKHGWLWYIVVGLILLLIGAILAAIGLGLVGWIFWLVGLIAIIYGLLVFIDVV